MKEFVNRENDFLKQVHQLHHLTTKPYILSKKTHGGAASAFSTLKPPQAHLTKPLGEVKSLQLSKSDNGVGCHAHNRLFKGGIKPMVSKLAQVEIVTIISIVLVFNRYGEQI